MSKFRVIIVGGGLGGLTLANCLQHAHIDYILLEGREKLGLHVGAAVGIEPQGARILDQLGVLSSLEPIIEPYTSFIFRSVDGKRKWSTDAPELLQARTGYPAWVYDRRFILGKLYDHLWDKDKVFLSNRVVQLEHFRDYIKVVCKDGTDFIGHIIIGNDGVNSVVRKEMWRLCEDEQPGTISLKEKDFLSVDYRGLYGISSPIKGIDTGNMTLIPSKDLVCYWVCGKGGMINWCLVEKIERRRPPNVPKYSDKEAHEYALKHFDKQLVSDTADVKFRDFWEQRQRYALVALEEGHLDQWSWGRIVCIGDSVHKVTPESGQGANQAIESAAGLANHIEKMLRVCGDTMPDLAAIRSCLTSFEAKRQPRSKAVVEETSSNVRLFTYSNAIFEFLARYVQQIFGDITANMLNNRHIGAERVDFLPVPSRSFTGTMLFNPTQGIGLFESASQRAIFAVPLLIGGFLSIWWTDQNLLSLIPQPIGDGRSPDISRSSPAAGLNQTASAEKRSNTLSLEALRLVYQYRLIVLLVDVAPVYLVWMIEANRRANYLKPIQLTLIFGLLATSHNLCFWANAFFFVHYVQSPIGIFAFTDQRLLKMNYARALLPSLLVSYTFFFVIALLRRPGLTYETLISKQQYIPMVLFITHSLFARMCSDTTRHDRLYNVKADVSILRRSYLFVGIISTATLQYIRFSSSMGGQLHSSFAEILQLQALPNRPALEAELGSQEHSAFYTGAALWLGLLFRDLKLAGMVKMSWLWLLILAVACGKVLGPGATFILGCAWREEVLANKRHWAAVTKTDPVASE